MDTRLQKDTSSTFVGNMSLPIHRWFRYSAGFSAEWAEETVNAYRSISATLSPLRIERSSPSKTRFGAPLTLR